ncbi:MAG: hypothetical protein HYV63_12495 [Candidatus Schekmanbacteria bacterium]|nr:hypothetical protein [Candidatus Schekmanbacteria bacterium]
MRDRGFGPPALLVDANRSPREVAFRIELDELTTRSSHIEVLHTASRVEPGDSWTHRVGRIDPPLLGEVAGPAGFVRTAASGLIAAGIARDDIRIELFRGYEDDPDAVET